MADTTILGIEPDEEERELERQILVLERKAKLRQRLKELRQAEEAAYSYVGSAKADPGEHHVLGSQPQQSEQLEETKESRDPKQLDEPPAVQPPRPTATNTPPVNISTSIVTPGLSSPLVPQAKPGSPGFLELTMFGLLGCSDPTLGADTTLEERVLGTRRPTTHAVGVAIQAEISPTFFSVDKQWMMMVGDEFWCRCSYSLTTLRRDEGPLLFQPRRAQKAYTVSELAMSISVVTAGQESHSVALGQRESVGRQSGNRKTTLVHDLEGPVLLAPMPHTSKAGKHSLWWGGTNDDDDGRIYGNSSRNGSRVSLPPWERKSKREHIFEGVQFKKKANDASEPTASSTATKTASPTAAPTVPAPAPAPIGVTATDKSRQKPVELTYIHLRVELLANLGNGEWTKVAHRRLMRLAVRRGGSNNPDEWHIVQPPRET